MSNSEQRARNCITLPMRLREIALNRAITLGEIIDDATEALRTGKRLNEVANMMAASKQYFVQAFEEGAEAEYQARMREQAMRAMERCRDMTAEQAVALVESTMLKTALAPGR